MDRTSSIDVNAEASDQAKMAAIARDDANLTPSGDAIDNAASLQRLLLHNADLALWLEHTRFFDLAHRERVLSGLRKLKSMEEERAKLLQELHGSTGGLMQSPAAQTSSLTQSPAAQSTTEVTTSKPLPPPSPTYFASSTPTSASGSIHGGFTADRTMAPPLPLAATSTIKGTPGYFKPRRHLAHAVTDSRFFLVKCSNTANVYMSQRDVSGLWVTQAKNGPAFTEAFKDCQSVILFFSINKSRGFQGFARMVSAPDPTIAKPDWIQKINLTAVTDPFRVEWINTAETDFDDVGELKNPMNEYRSVVVGRDGQEYPPECGRKMIALMNAAAQRPVRPYVPQPPQPRPMPYAGRSSEPTRSRSDSPDKDDDAARVERPWRKRDRVVVGAPQTTATIPLSQSAALGPEPRSRPGGVNLIDY
ncbi:Uncharacterized protein TPAR_02433 [Tolypocladium paradoxum]|uniref:YTH domain-containing protein n=1 Tax=Tolypocladium paradoxum TaxID=94208 RepID=A0A2S4L4I0_9HYPO|nr:Uncharacterized protein TPAR_02433 [Tolypocladium paradoxum]